MNLAGMVAQNICNGLLNPVSWEQSLNEDSFKIDTREPKVYNVGDWGEFHCRQIL